MFFCSLDYLKPLVQLEEESEKLLDKIILEDNIVLSTKGLPNPISSIRKWMEAKSMTLRTKVFPATSGRVALTQRARSSWRRRTAPRV